MNSVLHRASEAEAYDLIREYVADTDPTTGDEIALVTAADALALEIDLHDEETGLARFAYLLEAWA